MPKDTPAPPRRYFTSEIVTLTYHDESQALRVGPYLTVNRAVQRCLHVLIGRFGPAQLVGVTVTAFPLGDQTLAVVGVTVELLERPDLVPMGGVYLPTGEEPPHAG